MKLLSLLFAILHFLSAQPGPAAPACDGANLEFAQRTDFQLCFDSSRKVPIWTAYQMTSEQSHGSAPRPSHFRHDFGLAKPSAYDADYRGCGFSRGHMVPAEDLSFSNSAIEDTFLLSNVAPQILSLNLGLWRQLEEAVRRIAAHSDSVFVVTGPIFESGNGAVIGCDRVAVPSHFFKVILAVESEHRVMYAAIIPNTSALKDPLNSYAVKVKEVEQRCGLDFFSDLDDAEERELESSRQLFPVVMRRH